MEATVKLVNGPSSWKSNGSTPSTSANATSRVLVTPKTQTNFPRDSPVCDVLFFLLQRVLSGPSPSSLFFPFSFHFSPYIPRITPRPPSLSPSPPSILSREDSVIRATFIIRENSLHDTFQPRSKATPSKWDQCRGIAILCKQRRCIGLRPSPLAFSSLLSTLVESLVLPPLLSLSLLFLRFSSLHRCSTY